MTDTKPQIQDTQRTPRWINIKKFTARSIGFKLQKIKDKEKKLEKKPGLGDEVGDTLPIEEKG